MLILKMPANFSKTIEINNLNTNPVFSSTWQISIYNSVMRCDFTLVKIKIKKKVK